MIPSVYPLPAFRNSFCFSSVRNWNERFLIKEGVGLLIRRRRWEDIERNYNDRDDADGGRLDVERGLSRIDYDERMINILFNDRNMRILLFRLFLRFFSY